MTEHTTVQYCDVSVVIPCYRCAATLQRAVASVAAQTTLPREVILVDDDSDDSGKTSAAMEQVQAVYSSVFDVMLRHQVPNQGPGTARNLGWDLARSRFVALLDADDAWHPRKLEIQTTWMIAHPLIMLACHGSEVCRACTDVWGPQPSSQVRTRELGVRGLIWKNLVSTRTVMVQRVCSERFVEGSRFAEDFDLWLRIIGNGGRSAVIGTCLARSYEFPLGSSGLSSHLWAMEMGELCALEGVSRRHQLSTTWIRLAQAFSLLKFLRRAIAVALHLMTLKARHKGRLQ